MIKLSRALLAPVALFVALTPLVHAAPLLTLDPVNGQRTGSPGSTIGWGFSIQNDSSFYLVVTSVTATGFDPAVGSFSDYISSVNFIAVNPNSSYSEPANVVIPLGFGGFTILNSAALGSVTGADFEVLYDLLENDPNGPLGSSSNDIYGNTFNLVSAQVTVAAAPSADVPEPASAAVLAFACAAMTLARQRLRRR